ncbi:MAG TPA: long-chain fatty acid--CoA ligase [Blastocatellia bacterium]|jgi:long-chain acyl-CoA synthetase
MPENSPETIGRLLASRVEEYSDKEFLFSEPDGSALTYSAFAGEVARAARLLLSLGVKKGSRVSLLLTNRVEYLISYFACFEIGAWAGPVNAMLKTEEVEFIVSNSGAATVITEPDLLPNLDQALARSPRLRNVVVIEEGGRWSVVRSAAVSAARRKALESRGHAAITADDEAVIIYTSGTTGKPKGVLLTHGNIVSNARQISDWLGLGESDRALMIMPLFHVNALMTTCMAALWAGGRIVLAPRFSASRHWETISRYGISYFGSVATMLSLLVRTWPGGIPEGLDTGRLRFALCGSAPVPLEVIERFEKLFGCPVVEGYGLSESTCRSTFNPTDHRRRPGSVGLPIGNEVRVFDERDRELGPRQVGEIVLRGPNIMKGYYKNKRATREAFRSGWFHTGDLGYYDEDGFFYIVDRKSDMIIRGGENIYPREIDEVLYRHPKVKDAATVGVADALYGEEVKAFVVLVEGEQATEQEIIAYCRTHLADFKCPKSVEFLDEIPKGPTGKLLKRELERRGQ